MISLPLPEVLSPQMYVPQKAAVLSVYCKLSRVLAGLRSAMMDGDFSKSMRISASTLKYELWTDVPLRVDNPETQEQRLSSSPNTSLYSIWCHSSS